MQQKATTTTLKSTSRVFTCLVLIYLFSGLRQCEALSFNALHCTCRLCRVLGCGFIPEHTYVALGALMIDLGGLKAAFSFEDRVPLMLSTHLMGHPTTDWWFGLVVLGI